MQRRGRHGRPPSIERSLRTRVRMRVGMRLRIGMRLRMRLRVRMRIRARARMHVLVMGVRQGGGWQSVRRGHCVCVAKKRVADGLVEINQGSLW